MADDKKLKSSFDLAMERFARQGEKSVALSEQQKKAIAEAERQTKAKIAELEIMLKTRLAGAGEDLAQIEKIKSIHQAEIAKIRAKAEDEKEHLRKQTVLAD